MGSLPYPYIKKSPKFSFILFVCSLTVSFLFLVFLTQIVSKVYIKHPFTLMHDVKVIHKISDYQFTMSVQDPDTNIYNNFYIEFCPDFKPTDEIIDGVLLTTLKFIRNDAMKCEEIGRDNLGYILERNKYGKPIIHVW